MVDIDPNEAKAALEEARVYAARMKKTLNAFGAAYHFLIWGLIIMVGFTLDHFGPLLPKAIAIWHWLVLNVLGNILSFSITFRGRKTLKTKPQSGLGIIWVLFMGFGALGALFARPSGFREGTMLILLATMLWMGVMGALVNRTLLWAALGMTAAGIAAYYLAPGVFYLCLALAGGSTFISLGFYLLARRER